MKFPGIHADKLQAVAGQIGVAVFVLGFVNAIFVDASAWQDIALTFVFATTAIFFAILKIKVR